MIAFDAYNAPRIIYGEGVSKQVATLLQSLNVKTVMAVYDEGIKQVGIADSVLTPLREAGFVVEEFGGVTADPPVEMIEAAAKEADEKNVDIYIAIGGNENAAQVAGVNVTASLIRIYILASCMYALGGFLVGAKAGGASTNTGNGYELEAIAACTIGGVSTNGGVGKVSGVLVGVLVFEVLKICLQFLGVDPAYTYIAQGLVIVIAVALDLRKYLAKK